MVVAEVISVKPHPSADRLKVCSVDLGHDVAQVVTNAGNVAAGMKVIFAVCTLILQKACCSPAVSRVAFLATCHEHVLEMQCSPGFLYCL